MTEREWRLRLRIDKLTHERDFYRANGRWGLFPHPCVYCGALGLKRLGHPATCTMHRDLPALDSAYDEWAAA